MHCWGGNPYYAWYPWIKDKLEKNNFKVEILEMPEKDHPKIEPWVNTLKKTVGELDEKTYFIGHSIGCQTILRYLQSVEDDVKVGGVVFVGPWINLKDIVLESDGEKEIASPWLENPINWENVKKHLNNNFITIFSDDDPYVFLEDSKIFEKKCGAKVIIEHKKGHFDHDSGTKKLPVVLDSVLRLSN